MNDLIWICYCHWPFQKWTITKPIVNLTFNSAPTLPVGFWFGSRETFDGLANNSASGHYQSFGKPALGTQLNIHPNAYSASKADDDAGVITLIYSSGLSTGGR